MNSLSLLQAAPAQGGFDIRMIGMLAAVLLVFYFFFIRPQRKKQKETRQMLAAIQKGDKVSSIGGIQGTVHSVKETSVIVKVDRDTTLEFNKSAIASVHNAAQAADVAVKDKNSKPDKPVE